MRLGRYDILVPIGEGGMGAVFKGRDSVLGRNVAVKVLPERLRRDPPARARFEREARLLAALSHPNILAIHDVGEDADTVFVVMEYLEGLTLRDRLRSGPLAPDEALPYALDVARGLAAAHAKGIVHRDLKPENVFLPVTGPLRILDFGIARIEPHGAPMDTNADTCLTEPGVMLGTVAYMSPEQLRGLEADARSDVFAFGALLYEMLSGRAPFAGPSSVDIMSAVLTQEAPPLAPQLAHADAIVRVCLDKEPNRRYRSAQELVAALEAIQPMSRRSAAITLGHPQPAPSSAAAPQSIAVLPFVDMSPGKSLEFLCEGIAEEILLGLTRIDGLRVVARSSAFRFKGTSEDVRSIGRTLGVDTVLEGSVRAVADRIRVVTQLVNTSDGYQVWSERFDRQLDDVFAVQDEIAGAVASMLRGHVHDTSSIAARSSGPHDAQAYTLYLKARHHWNRRTEADLHRSVDYFKKCLERAPRYALAHAGLAEAYVTLGIYGAVPPDDAMPKARTAATEALAIGPPLPGALTSLGCVHALYEWNWADAERQFARAVDVLHGASSPRASYAMNYLVPRGRFVEAERELRRAQDVDPLSATIAASLGIRSYFAHRFEDAAQELMRAFDVDPHFALAHQFLGLVLTELTRHDEALREIEIAIRLSGGSPETIAAAGYSLARAGNRDGAGTRLGELLALSTSRYVSPGLIAQVHAGLGSTGEAAAWLEKAFAARAADAAWLDVRPVFDPLRADARFQAIAARLNLGAS
jgi:serine/threonine protein kinase/tetratricopeptide (TPR) repeat protein